VSPRTLQTPLVDEIRLVSERLALEQPARLPLPVSMFHSERDRKSFSTARFVQCLRRGKRLPCWVRLGSGGPPYCMWLVTGLPPRRTDFYFRAVRVGFEGRGH